MKKIRLITVVSSLAFIVLLLNSSVQAKFLWWGQSNEDDIVPTKIMQQDESPVRIVKASIDDMGTKFLKIKNIRKTFSATIKNTTDKEILSVQLVWVRHVPFAPYLTKDVRVNSPSPLAPKKQQTITFRTPNSPRAEAYYEVWIGKVLFADKTIWESPLKPSEEELLTKAEQEIESMSDELNFDKVKKYAEEHKAK